MILLSAAVIPNAAVILSAAKDLPAIAERFFAALRMTVLSE
jgi:hypothetical protein